MVTHGVIKTNWYKMVLSSPARLYGIKDLRAEVQADCYGWVSVEGAASGGVGFGSASVAGGASLSPAVHCL